jgi:hypothetical protein
MEGAHASTQVQQKTKIQFEQPVTQQQQQAQGSQHQEQTPQPIAQQPPFL